MPRRGPRPQQGFDRALEQGDLANAWLYAHDLPVIPLYKALWLTLLIGIEGRPGYEAACRRFMVLFIREQRPGTEAMAKLAASLDAAGDDMRQPECRMALEALWDLVDRLRGEDRGPRPQRSR